MTEDQINTFYQRIDNLKIDEKAIWGQMTVTQMLCHCADQIRMALGTKKPTVYGTRAAAEIMALAKTGQIVPTPPGFGQVEGEGTPSINFEKDRQLLKGLIIEFSKSDKDFIFAPHAYFGTVTRERWNTLVIYHLDHHLKQFGV